MVCKRNASARRRDAVKDGLTKSLDSARQFTHIYIYIYTYIYTYLFTRFQKLLPAFSPSHSSIYISRYTPTRSLAYLITLLQTKYSHATALYMSLPTARRSLAQKKKKLGTLCCAVCHDRPKLQPRGNFIHQPYHHHHHHHHYKHHSLPFIHSSTRSIKWACFPRKARALPNLSPEKT